MSKSMKEVIARVLIAARIYIAAGLSVIPIKPDGSKAPTVAWKRFQGKLPSPEEIEILFQGNVGIAIITGKVSGNTEVYDFDKPGLFEPFAKLVEERLPGLLARLPQCSTPSLGMHLYTRCSTIDSNKKLAVDAEGKVLIETRGEGGYVLAPPSPASCHPDGKEYIHVGGPAIIDVPTITVHERNVLLEICRSFNQKPKRVENGKLHEPIGKSDGSQRPGDDFNASATWEEFLLKHGWTIERKSGDVTYWRRPGKTDPGVSATTGHCGDLLYVFSSNAGPFEPDTGYSKFAAFALLEHGGDFSAAASELAKKGFGRQNTASNNEGKDDCWDDQIPFDEIETPDIPAKLLPGELGEFAAALAAATEIPEALAVMSVLGVVSAASTKRFQVSPKDGWLEPVNIYTLVALPPANNKTQVFNACSEPLVAWEREQVKSLEPEIKHQRSERKSHEKIIESLRTKAARERDISKQRELIREIADKETSLIEPRVLPQLFANDTTPEALANNVYEQGGRFAIFSDEGGIVETMSGLYSGGTANVDILLKGIDGGHVRVRRKDRNFDINPFITIVLAVQPIIIQNMKSKKAFNGNGMLERFFYVLPKSRLGYRTHDKPPVSEKIRQAYHRKIKTLLDIQPLLEDGQERPRILTLSSDALQDWREFQASIEIQLRPEGRLYSCLGSGGKICGFALRIAGLLHVAEYGQSHLVISADTMARALELAALLSEHTIAAYGLMGADQATEDAKEVFKWIAAQQKPSLTKTEITLALRHKSLGKSERLSKALDILINRNMISKPQRLATRKPTTVYHINSALFERGK